MSAFVETLAPDVSALLPRRLAEHFPAAILCADISGFIPLAERLAQATI